MKMNVLTAAAGAAALLFGWIAAPPAGATTLERLSLTELARAADTVVSAQCISAESRWDAGAIWTITEFDLLEVFKGAPPSRLIVRLPGGRVGHIVASVEAVPRFRPGEQGFLFLEKSGNGEYSVTAWAEGTFRVRPATPGGLVTVTQDSSAFSVFDVNTRRFRTEGVHRMPVGQFREQLLAALTAAADGSAR